MTDQDRLMRRYSEMRFAAHETALFLDSHPTDAVALQAMKEYASKANAYKAEYEEKYGPICVMSVGENDKTWQWVKNPWPWQ